MQRKRTGRLRLFKFEVIIVKADPCVVKTLFSQQNCAIRCIAHHSKPKKNRCIASVLFLLCSVGDERSPVLFYICAEDVFIILGNDVLFCGIPVRGVGIALNFDVHRAVYVDGAAEVLLALAVGMIAKIVACYGDIPCRVDINGVLGGTVADCIVGDTE